MRSPSTRLAAVAVAASAALSGCTSGTVFGEVDDREAQAIVRKVADDVIQRIAPTYNCGCAGNSCTVTCAREGPVDCSLGSSRHVSRVQGLSLAGTVSPLTLQGEMSYDECSWSNTTLSGLYVTGKVLAEGTLGYRRWPGTSRLDRERIESLRLTGTIRWSVPADVRAGECALDVVLEGGRPYSIVGRFCGQPIELRNASYL